MKKMAANEIIEKRIELLTQQQRMLRAGGIENLPAEYFTNEETLDSLYAQMEAAAEPASRPEPKELIHESAKETAAKIRKWLKSNYPGSKFSVTSESFSFHSTVAIKFKDGAEPDHDKLSDQLHEFRSTSFDGMTDSSEVKGYEYEGKWYYGADYIRYSRR